jgi:hypothetical protein
MGYYQKITGQSPDLFLDISMGKYENVSWINKFGENPSSASGVKEDLWDGGGTYTFPATADITHLSQAVDQVAMRGQNIVVEGLDTNWDMATQTKALDAANTTTAVALDTPLRRVYRMFVAANVVGDQNINAKNVGGGTTYATIQAGNNQTLMAIYTVPRNKIGYMVSYYGDTVLETGVEPRSVEFDLWFADRENNYEFQVKHHIGVPRDSGGRQHFFSPYYKITQKTDVKITSLPDNQPAHVNGGFDIILVDM